jgi:hypothetical protein
MGTDSGLPSGFDWQDQGNTTPPNVGDTVTASVVGPDGSQYAVPGTVLASDGTNVTIATNSDVVDPEAVSGGIATPDAGVIIAAGTQMTVPVSYVAEVAGDNQNYYEGLPPSSSASSDLGETGPEGG